MNSCININNKEKKIFCLSGLPRSGSTLLSAILNQNPIIHSEGNSALCQLMWDAFNSLNGNAKEQLAANNKQNIDFDLIRGIFKIYYKNVLDEESIIIDKSRAWTHPENLHIINKYIDPNIKIIVLERPINEIVKSLGKIMENNLIGINLKQFLIPNTEPLMRSLAGLHWAKNNNINNTFLFITYDELVSKPREVIKGIYDFLKLDYYEHNFDNIINKYNENDNAYPVKDLHRIRPIIGKQENNYILDPEIESICEQLENIRKNS
jgi:sulfotransferase